MKIKVIKNGYYVSEDLTNLGMIDQGTFENSFTHSLVVGDVWEEDEDGFFECIEGKWEGESSDGWWEYDHVTDHFEILEL
jgi:hypothetical protein